MSYLATSQDILNITLAISVFGVALLVTWILVYAVIIIRRVVKIIEGAERAVQKVNGLVDAARDRLESSMGYLSVLATGAKELASFIMREREKRTKPAGKKKGKEE